MSHHHQSSSLLESFISLFIEILSALSLSLLTLLIAVPLLGFIIYLCCALLFPASWAFPITAAFWYVSYSLRPFFLGMTRKPASIRPLLF